MSEHTCGSTRHTQYGTPRPSVTSLPIDPYLKCSWSVAKSSGTLTCCTCLKMAKNTRPTPASTSTGASHRCRLKTELLSVSEATGHVLPADGREPPSYGTRASRMGASQLMRSQKPSTVSPAHFDCC